MSEVLEQEVKAKTQISELRVSKKRQRKEKEGKLNQKERLQCQFVIPKKNRLCPMTRKPENQFCSQHMGDRPGDKRISCPVDPRHTVWESEVKGHVMKCEMKMNSNRQASWFKLDHNCEKRSTPAIEFKEDYKKWIPVVEKLYENYEPLELIQKQYEGVESRLNELSNQKHILQQSSLIANLNEAGLLSHKYTYVEFGCGRAELSRYFLQSILFKDKEPSDFILIDRSPTRLKLDGKMVKDVEEFNSGLKNKVFRMRIDIKDLDMDAVIEEEFSESSDGKYVAISKHLCGAATDLTIQCILKNPVFKSKFQGMIVAMCCRHCCDYDMLSSVGKQYLMDHGIDEMGFKHLMKFASWAVNGRRPNMKDEDGSDHASGLNIKQREELGHKARRIIDETRRFTIEKNGEFKSELFQYCSKDVSLENTCMLVTR